MRTAGNPGGPLVGVVLWGGNAVVLGCTVLRLLGLDRWRHTVAVLALTPYVLGGALVLLLAALLARRAAAGVVAFVLSVALALVVLPRALPDAQPAASGQRLVVASANLHFGDGALGGIVDLVRDRQVDVLSLLELTPSAVEALDAAGLAEQLPHRIFYTAPGAAGSGLAARHPMTQLVLTPPSVMRQPAAMVGLPGGGTVEVQVVHPVQPLSQHGNAAWRADLGRLPAPREDGTVRLLVGDFNSTLDHPPLRRLLAAGYVDAADQVGAGLDATWPTDRGLWPPQVAIDHVLADPRCAVKAFAVRDVPRSDHRAIVTELTLP